MSEYRIYIYIGIITARGVYIMVAVINGSWPRQLRNAPGPQLTDKNRHNLFSEAVAFLPPGAAPLAPTLRLCTCAAAL